MDIVISKYDVDHVRANNKKLFNTNNHYIMEGIDQPADYREVLDKGKTSNWIDKFRDNYCTITFDKGDLRWMREALKIGCITGEFSKLYQEELEEICKKYTIPEGKWFVRSEYVSLKEGKHGIGPYTDIRSIIESIVTTVTCHMFFRDDDTSCIMYLINWLEIDQEFRVFVYQNEITAISTQHIYIPNMWLAARTDEELKTLVRMILDYFDRHIKDKMKYMSNYTMDLALVNGVPYFIEPNSFGKYYAAGSALFQWEIDHEILHDSSSVAFRYT